jgi:hypothetical protein
MVGLREQNSRHTVWEISRGEELGAAAFLGPAQNALFDLDLIKIFAMRFMKPRPGLHCGFHVFADGT